MAIILWFKLSDILHCKPVWCFRKKLKSNMHSEDGKNSNPVRSILVCFMCKHYNPMQSALKLLKGTICAMQWITFFDAKQCHWTSFQACYVSVNFNPLPERPPGNRTFSLPGGSGFRPTFFARGTVGVLNYRNFLKFWKKNAGISRFVSKKPEAAWKEGVNSRTVSYQFLHKKIDKCLLYL